MDPADLDETLADALSGRRPVDAQTLNMACFWISRRLAELTFSTPAAAPLTRHLLRVAGRVIIDTGAPDADPATWSNTEEMALQWLAEALKPLGYEVRPSAEGGRHELPPPAAGWDQG